MTDRCNILGIVASPRRTSYSRSATRDAAQLVPADARIEVFEIDSIPGFTQTLAKREPGMTHRRPR